MTYVYMKDANHRLFLRLFINANHMREGHSAPSFHIATVFLLDSLYICLMIRRDLNDHMDLSSIYIDETNLFEVVIDLYIDATLIKSVIIK
jgi:hypothetical protein